VKYDANTSRVKEVESLERDLAHPDEGAVALAEVFGLFSLAYGISSLIVSLSLRASADTQASVR
jgi:hypothetical protein